MKYTRHNLIGIEFKYERNTYRICSCGSKVLSHANDLTHVRITTVHQPNKKSTVGQLWTKETAIRYFETGIWLPLTSNANSYEIY